MSAIAIRHALGLAYEVDRALHVTEALGGGQAEHPANERTIDACGVVRCLCCSCFDVRAFAYGRSACVCRVSQGLVLGCVLHGLNSTGGTQPRKGAAALDLKQADVGEIAT